MRNRRQIRTHLLLAIAIAIVCAGAALGPLVAGAAQGATVTAVVGSTLGQGDQPLEQLGGLPEGAPVETADDGGCSLLLEENALVEVCADTKLSLRKREPGGPRVLDVQKGNVRVSAEKRLGDERIEIHTPAVIATILGTVVFVSVDALGVTTITSEVSRVMVASSNTAISQATVIEGGQQLVVNPGEPPPVKPQRLEATQMAALGGCLVDFHSASLQADRKEMLAKEIDSISEADATTADLPEVALVEPGTGGGGWPPPGGPGTPDFPGPELGEPSGGNDDPQLPYPATEVNPAVEELMSEMIDEGPDTGGDFPEDCPGGFPGEQCGPF
jgi:ferric-dicitrate binding protein FerR (iron transport regulator)